MANRWLFAGGAEAVRSLAGVVTTGTQYDAIYADHSIKANSSNRHAVDFFDASANSDSVTAGERLYFRFDMTLTAGGATFTSENAIVFRDNNDYPWLAFRFTAATAITLYYNSGTGPSPVWTSLGLASTSVGFTRMTFVAWLDLDAGGNHLAGYAVDSSFVGEAEFTQASLSSIHYVELRSANSGYRDYAEIMASVGINLVNSHLNHDPPTGAGASSGFTSGTFADIDDAGINDADYIESLTAGQRSTFTHAGVPALLPGQALGDVFLWQRAANASGAPSNIKPVRRDSGGTDNVGSNFSGIAGAFQTFLTRYSAPSEAEYNASQFGVESAT